MPIDCNSIGKITTPSLLRDDVLNCQIGASPSWVSREAARHVRVDGNVGLVPLG